MRIRITPVAEADLARLPRRIAAQIVNKIARLEAGLSGNIKRLQHAAAGYRLRSGDYRILFDIEADTVIVQTIKNRKEAYD